MDGLPNFLTHGAPLRARFARAGAPLKGSTDCFEPIGRGHYSKMQKKQKSAVQKYITTNIDTKTKKSVSVKKIGRSKKRGTK